MNTESPDGGGNGITPSRTVKNQRSDIATRRNQVEAMIDAYYVSGQRQAYLEGYVDALDHAMKELDKLENWLDGLDTSGVDE